MNGTQPSFSHIATRVSHACDDARHKTISDPLYADHLSLNMANIFIRTSPLELKQPHSGFLKALALTTTALIAFSAVSPYALADTFEWDNGAGDFNFNNGLNWNNITAGGTGVPGVGDTATINPAGLATAGLSTNHTVDFLNVTGNGRLNITGANTLTVNNNVFHGPVTAASIIEGTGTLSVSRTYTLSGGVVTIDNLRAQNYDIDSGTISTHLQNIATPTGVFGADIDGGTFDDANRMMDITSSNRSIIITIDNATITNKSTDAITTNSGTAQTDITINNSAFTTDAIGVNSTSSDGNINITANSTITSLTGAIQGVTTGSGDVMITGSGQLNGTVGGISAQSNSGDVTVSGTGNIQTGGAGFGIGAAIQTGSGNILINRSGTILAGSNGGIIATNTGSGLITIEDNGIVESQGDAYIKTTADGGGNTIISTAAAIRGAATNGIQATASGGAGNGTITIDLGSTIGAGSMPTGAGINTTAVNGTTTINADQDISATTTGIDANASGTGLIDINVSAGTIAAANGIDADQTGTGNIDIDVTGGAINGTTTGISGVASGGNVDINIAAGTIGTTAGNTLAGQTTGAGTVTISTDVALNATTGNVIKMDAQTGKTTITANAALTNTGGNAVDADSTTGEIEININNGATGTADPINASTATGNINLTNAIGSTINVTTGTRAINFSSGAGATHTITNSGTINGEIDETLGDTTFTNNAGGTWRPSGDDGGSTTSSFSTGTDTINNAGTIEVADKIVALAAADVDITGVENFTNTGTIDLQNDQGTASLTTDRFTVTASTGTTNYTGGGTIKLDTFLGGAGSATDLVTIGQAANNGVVSGTTSLVINDTNPAVNGTLGADIVVVRVANTGAGTTSASDFSLSGGRIVKGTVEYNLQYTAGVGGFDVFSLVSSTFTPDVSLSTAKLSETSHNLFHDSVNAMVDRQGDTRDNVAEYGKSGGFWMHTFGSKIDRDATGQASIAGVNTTSDTSYDQTTYGMYVGVDNTFRGITHANDYLMAGFFAGFLGADVDFSSSASKINYSGYTAGLYSTYINGGFYKDILVKIDKLDARFYDHTQNAAAVTDVTNIGGRLGMGYKITYDDGVYLDPFGKLTYVSSNVDTFTIGNATNDLGRNDSLRGQFGARVGKNFEEGAHKYDTFLTASVVHEFDGKNKATLTDITATNVTDDADLTLLNIGAGIDIESPVEGVNFYARANTDIGDDYFGYSGKLGFNIKL